MPIQRPPPFLLGAGVVLLLCLTAGACVAQTPVVPQKPLPQQPPKDRYWTTHWSFQGVDVKRLFSRLSSIGLDIPVNCDGDVSVEFDVGVPLTNLRDGKAYRFKGHLKSKRLRLENLLLENFDAEVNYRDGVLNLADVKGRWSDATVTDKGGSFEGVAIAQLLPRGDFQTDIHANTLPLGPLHDLLFSASHQPRVRPIRGTVSGDLHFNAPIDQLQNVAGWTANADLRINNFRFDGSQPLSARTGPVLIRGGVVQAEQVELTSPSSDDVRLKLAIQAELAGRQRFQFRIRGNDLPLDTLTEMVYPEGHIATGKLDIDAHGKGELASEAWDIQGRLGSPKLTVLGQNLGLVEHQFKFDQQRLELRAIDPAAADREDAILLKEVLVAYFLNEDSLHITDITARVFDGTFQGTATLARIPTLNHHVKLSWRNLRLVVNVAPLLPTAVKLSSVTSGTIDWSLPSAASGTLQMQQGVAHIKLDQIAVGQENVGDLQLDLRAADSTVELVGEGKIFGGSFHFDTRSDLDAGDSWSTLLTARSGQAKAERMRLDRIVRVTQPDSSRRWSGTLSGLFDWQDKAVSPAQQMPTIRLSAHDVFVDGRSVSRRVEMLLRLKDDMIVIDHVSGSYAGGNFSAVGGWSFGRGKRQVQLRFARIDAGVALLPISPDAASRVEGKVSGTITVTGDNPLRFGGVITAHHSSFFSVPTGTVHSGIRGSISPDLRRWKVALPSIHGQLAEGRVTAEARLCSSSVHSQGFDLTSRWKLRNVDFGKLIAATGSSSTIASGKMTGSLSLAGRGIRSASDLMGRFDAKLGTTQAAAVPGLVQADQFLGVISLAGVQFTEGHIDGVIRAGAASIDEFWLKSDRVNVWSEGNIQLANQKMDLDVVISTGNLQSGNARLLALAAQLAIQAALPITTLVEVNRILRHRTIHLSFNGPLSDPRIRLRPLAILREEAVRFLLRELLVATSASSSLL